MFSRWSHRYAAKTKPLHGIQSGSPMVVAFLGQQDHVGDKTIVILYTYTNCHTGTLIKTKTKKDKMSLDYSSSIFVTLGLESDRCSSTIYYIIIILNLPSSKL